MAQDIRFTEIQTFQDGHVLSASDMNTIGTNVNALSAQSASVINKADQVYGLRLYRDSQGYLCEIDDQQVEGIPHDEHPQFYVARDVIKQIAQIRKLIQDLNKKVDSYTRYGTIDSVSGSVLKP